VDNYMDFIPVSKYDKSRDLRSYPYSIKEEPDEAESINF
jgi:hypothetical protein